MSLPLLSNILLFFHLFGLYAFMGLKAPLPVKYSCILQSNQQVTQKFTQPLAFDVTSKNALREFWHYSYFRQCLHKRGFDSKGNKLSPSLVTSKTYSNPQANLTLNAVNPTIQSDNILDVDYDDRLLLSQLVLSDKPVTLAVYTRHDDLKSAIESSKIPYFPGVTDPIVAATFSGQTALLTDSLGRMGLLFFSPDNLPRLLYGPHLSPDFLISLFWKTLLK